MNDAVLYNQALYAKSPAHRLARINHVRRRRGQPEAASLAQVALRKPLEAVHD